MQRRASFGARHRRALLLGSSAALLLAEGCNAILGIGGDFTMGTASTASGGSTSSSSGGPGVTASGSTGTMTTTTGSMTGTTTGSGSTSTGMCMVPALATSADIVPPCKFMNLDICGAGNQGIKYPDAVAVNCMGTPVPMQSPPFSGTTGVYWDPSMMHPGAATLYYDLTTQEVGEVEMHAGYTGKLTWKGTNGTDTYVAQIGQPITKNGTVFTLDWGSPPDASNNAQLSAEVNELYNSLMATFVPGSQPVNDCHKVPSGTATINNCLTFADTTNNVGLFGVRPLQFYFVFGGVDTMSSTSVPTEFYEYAPVRYHDISQTTSYWSSFDPSTVDPTENGFRGAELGGNNDIYLVPNAPGKNVLRYDTNKSFTDVNSWSKFDPSTVNPKANAFSGGASDGQAIYLAPSMNGTVVRHDTTQAFGSSTSWSTFDTMTLLPQAQQFAGGGFSAQTGAVLFAPANSGVVAVYNSYAGAFNDGANWQSFDLTTLNANLKNFHGAGALKRYIYLAPHGIGPFPGLAARWDSQSPNVSVPTSWETMDLSLVDPGMTGTLAFDGVISDGVQYVYYIGASNNSANGVDVMRYDSSGPFNAPTSWQHRGIQGPYTTATWDGRFLYLSGPTSFLDRYDSTKSFTSFQAPWDHFDMSGVNNKAASFYGSVFDFRAAYFAPDGPGAPIIRFDAKLPPFYDPGGKSSY